MKSAILAFAATLALAPAAAAQEHDHHGAGHGDHGAQAPVPAAHGEEHAEHAHDAAHYASAMHAEHTLRETIAGLQAGTPDYDRMVPELAEAVRAQAAVMGPQLAGLGEIQTVEHQAEPQPGAHQFLVTFAGGPTTWTIAVNAENKIAGLFVR